MKSSNHTRGTAVARDAFLVVELLHVFADGRDLVDHTPGAHSAQEVHQALSRVVRFVHDVDVGL